MSSEIFGQSIKIIASGNTPLQHVQALIRTFVELQNSTLQDSEGNSINKDLWSLEGYDYDNGIMLIKCLTPSAKFDPDDSFEPAYNSQIILKAASTTNIQIAYDPEGSINKDLNSNTWGIDANKSNSFSGFKNITGSTANWSNTNSTIYLTYYEDALTLFFPGVNVISYAAHIGKIYLPDNRSDLKIGIDGSGIFIGQPSQSTASTSANAWIGTQSSAVNREVSSCIKISDTTWTTIRTFDATASQYTTDVAGKSRLVPYTISGNIPAAGEVGRTKYLRAYKTQLPNLTLLESAVDNSKQAWIGWSVAANTPQKCIMLWCKKVNIAELDTTTLPPLSPI